MQAGSSFVRTLFISPPLPAVSVTGSVQLTKDTNTEVLPGLGLDAAPMVVIAPVAPDQAASSARLDASQWKDPNGRRSPFLWPNPTHNAAITGGNTATPTVQFDSGRGLYSFTVMVTNSQGAGVPDRLHQLLRQAVCAIRAGRNHFFPAARPAAL